MRQIWVTFLVTALLFTAGCFFEDSSEDDLYPVEGVKLVSVSVEASSFVRSEADRLAFSWRVWLEEWKCKTYDLEVFVSTDESLDDSDLLIFSMEGLEVLSGTYEVLPGDPAYESVSELLPSDYFVVFKATCNNYSSIATTPFKVIQPKRKWTVMVYMAGDNSLSSFVTSDLNEMAQVGSTEAVNIVAILDRSWDEARLAFVKAGEVAELKALGEVNMADPETLSSFGKWVIEHYPADHYLLVLWNHGLGFKKAFSSRDIFEDDHPIANSWMSIPSLGGALSEITSYLGRRLDVIGFDACLMAMFEVAYELKDYAYFMVGSENWEPGDGWDYERALWPLYENASLTPRDLALALVEAYKDAYTSYSDELTFSAVDLTRIGSVKNAFEALVSSLSSLLPEVGTVLTDEVFLDVQRFDDGSYWGISPDDDSFADLYHFAELINAKVPEAAEEAQGLMDAVSYAVIGNWRSGPLVSGAYGLSFWFPNPNIYESDEWNYYYEHYGELKFAKEASWDEFLKELWGF